MNEGKCRISLRPDVRRRRMAHIYKEGSYGTRESTLFVE